MLITRKNITQKRNTAKIKKQKRKKCMSVYTMLSRVIELLVQHFETILPHDEAT